MVVHWTRFRRKFKKGTLNLDSTIHQKGTELANRSSTCQLGVLKAREACRFTAQSTWVPVPTLAPGGSLSCCPLKTPIHILEAIL